MTRAEVEAMRDEPYVVAGHTITTQKRIHKLATALLDAWKHEEEIMALAQDIDAQLDTARAALEQIYDHVSMDHLSLRRLCFKALAAIDAGEES